MRPRLSICVLALAMPAVASARAQQVDAFANLPLVVNRGDQLRVENQSGRRVTGPLVAFAPGGLTLGTGGADKRFSAADVRRVELSTAEFEPGGLLIGVGASAAAGLLACPGGFIKAECTGMTTAFGAVILGAPYLQALIPRMLGQFPSSRIVYQAPASGLPVPGTRGESASSLLDELGMGVNLGDRVTAETMSGERISGRIVGLTDDWLAIALDRGARQLGREQIRRVTVERRHVRAAAFIGYLGFAAAEGMSSGRNSESVGVPFAGLLGAGAGALIGLVIHTTSDVYPAPAWRVSVAPSLGNGRVGFGATYRW